MTGNLHLTLFRNFPPVLPLVALGGLLVLLCPESAGAGERKALVFGNQDYADTGRFPDLRTTRADAEEMASLLRAGGFQVTEPVLDSTRIGMENALESFTESLRPGDEAVVYYAGHGVQYQNKVWLMGTNAEFRFQDKLGSEAIDDEFVSALLGRRKVRIAVILLDCCREAPDQSWLASAIKKRGLRSAEQESHANLNPPPNILVGYATSSKRLTNDLLGPNDRNGPLVKALGANWIAGLEFDALWKKVTKEVYKRSLEVAKKYPEVEIQMPSKYGQTIHDFYFVNGGERTNPDSSPQVLGDMEKEKWNAFSIVRKNDENVGPKEISDQKILHQVVSAKFSAEFLSNNIPVESFWNGRTLEIQWTEKGFSKSEIEAIGTVSGYEFWTLTAYSDNDIAGKMLFRKKATNSNTEFRMIAKIPAEQGWYSEPAIWIEEDSNLVAIQKRNMQYHTEPGHLFLFSVEDSGDLKLLETMEVDSSYTSSENYKEIVERLKP